MAAKMAHKAVMALFIALAATAFAPIAAAAPRTLLTLVGGPPRNMTNHQVTLRCSHRDAPLCTLRLILHGFYTQLSCCEELQGSTVSWKHQPN